jgi:rhodanese-related sulfurtransferase
MKKMKKYIWRAVTAAILIAVCTFLAGRYLFPAERLAVLPKPQVSEGERGQLGIDKNINESNIDDYLGRSDSVYRDMRMLIDPANYEAIGGDAYLSGFVKGFEVVPMPYLIPATGLPEAVGSSYTGTTLFSQNEDGEYVANYVESMDILEALFPKDKNIFLMCGGGGYAGMTKNLLVSLGWNEEKIFNVGGYWSYKGKNNVAVKTERDGKVAYDFFKVPYHNIDFSTLTAK